MCLGQRSLEPTGAGLALGRLKRKWVWAKLTLRLSWGTTKDWKEIRQETDQEGCSGAYSPWGCHQIESNIEQHILALVSAGVPPMWPKLAQPGTEHIFYRLLTRVYTYAWATTNVHRVLTPGLNSIFQTVWLKRSYF